MRSERPNRVLCYLPIDLLATAENLLSVAHHSFQTVLSKTVVELFRALANQVFRQRPGTFRGIGMVITLGDDPDGRHATIDADAKVDEVIFEKHLVFPANPLVTNI